MTNFRKRLQNQQVVLGQMVLELFTPGIGPMLAAAGMEFVIFDMEHGRCDIGLMAEMIASCRGSEIVPMARVADLSSAPLSRLLDIGARGVMVPRVETCEQAEQIVAELKYPPAGRRGVALGIAHDSYQPGGPEFFVQANQANAVILLLETVKAFEHLDEIISVPGVDVAWMGHYDLTVSMGIPGQFEHPRFLEAMDALVASRPTTGSFDRARNVGRSLDSLLDEFTRLWYGESRTGSILAAHLGGFCLDWDSS